MKPKNPQKLKKRKRTKRERDEEKERRALMAVMRKDWEFKNRVWKLNPRWKPQMPVEFKWLWVSRSKSKKYLPSSCPECKEVLQGGNRSRHIKRCQAPKKRGRPRVHMPDGLAPPPGVRGDGGQQLVIRQAARARRNRELLEEGLRLLWGQ